MATDRDRRRNTQRGSRRSRRSVGRGSVIFTPRPRASARYAKPGTDPALLLLRGDPGWSPRPARTFPAIKRSDKAAMFICRNRGKEKREECRVEGEVYLRAARADKIIRQKTPGVDDGEARGGSGLQTGRSERRKKERRGNERWRDRPVRPGRMGKESCIADVVDAAAHESEEGRRVQGRPEKEETGQECTDECVVLRATRPRRLSRERVSELSLESPFCLARLAVRIRGRRSLSRGCTETGTGLLYIIHP